MTNKEFINVVKAINEIESIDDLISMMETEIDYDISYRGGGIAINANYFLLQCGVAIEGCPDIFSVYCNYLGGGLRGSICTFSIPESFKGEKRSILVAVQKMLRRVYADAENAFGLNDGSWEAQGTEACRNAGIESAY
jgi:hypothetical protein